MQFDPSITQMRWQGPLGPMLLAATRQGLAGLWFADQRHLPDSSAWPEAGTTGAQQPVLQLALRQLRAYFDDPRRPFDLPLDLSGGSAFQQAVWQALLGIPAGQTTSYGALAAALGRPAAVRALGAAVGRNPISIVVPCHRVIGKDGSLTGYAGGLARKTALLRMEGAA